MSTSAAILFLTPGMSLIVILPWGITPVLAQESVYQEVPTPSSVQEDVSPIERSFVEKIPRPGLFPWVKK